VFDDFQPFWHLFDAVFGFTALDGQLMDTWPWWFYIRIVSATLALMGAGVLLVLLWRMRGIWHWKQSLRQELLALRREQVKAQGPRQAALSRVLTTCEGIWYSTVPDIALVTQLRPYIHAIAQAFHPQDPRPELRLTLGKLLMALQQVSQRLAQVLGRRGFQRLGRLRIRQIRKGIGWYQTVSANRLLGWLLARRTAWIRLLLALRLALPDPLTWAAYFSRRYALMLMTRCLVLDFYIFIGQVAVDAFDGSGLERLPAMAESESRQLLQEMEALAAEENPLGDPQLQAIRQALVRIPARLLTPPDLDEWWAAVRQSAAIVAARHFPEAAAPLEEATVNALMDRTRAWIETVSAMGRLPVVRTFLRIQLAVILDLKPVVQGALSLGNSRISRTLWSAYRWGRWPTRFYRWFKRSTAPGMAAEVGFILARKGLANYLCRCSFDHACRELEMVYRRSAPQPARARDNTEKEINIGAP
jgi:hypothetical protein